MDSLRESLPEEKEEYAAFLTSHRNDLQPAGALRRLLVEEIALAYIRLRRVHAAEMRSFEPRTITSKSWEHGRGHYEHTYKTEGFTMDHFPDKTAGLRRSARQRMV